MAEAVSEFGPMGQQPAAAAGAAGIQLTPQPAITSGEQGAPEFFIDLRPRFVKLPDISEKEKINIRYPLLPPYAFAHIYWDNTAKELLYSVEEVLLTDTEKELLKLIQLGLEEMINISYAYASKSELIIKYLEKNVQSILAELGAKVSKQSYLKIMYYVYRDFVGLNEIEPMMHDFYIEDIECNGSETPLYIVHRRYQNMRTNVVFSDIKRLIDFVEKLAQKTGRYVSFAKPLLDGTLPDGSRVNATYTSDVTTHGPTFTIRKFTKDPLTPVHLLGYKTASPEIFGFFWLAIEHKFNIMTIGETASGKTTLLNSILQFVPPEARIVSIEDTRELNIAHDNWIPAVARVGFGIPNLLGKQYGEISLFDLLRETFRQNPDYVVVGEVRGKETYVLFQGMASIPGDQKVMVIQDSRPKLTRIDEITDVSNCQTVAFDTMTCEVKLLPVKAHIRHPERSELVKVTTKTGREIIATPDHSLFAIGSQNQMVDVPAGALKAGDKLAIASRIPCGYADINKLNLIEIIPNIRIYAPELIKEASHKLGYYRASAVCGVASITDYYGNFKRASPASMKRDMFFSLMEAAGTPVEKAELSVKLLRKSRPMRAELEITDEFLRLLGYFISEGTVNFSGKNSAVALYNKNPEVLEDMRRCLTEVTGIIPAERVTARGFGEATELKIGNRIYAELLKALCGKSKEKRIPDFIFGLSKGRIGQFLSGLFTGDGHTTHQSFGYTTILKELARQLQQLLLVYGIVASVYWNKSKKTYGVAFYREEDKEEFFKHVKVLGRKDFLRKAKTVNCKKVNDVYLDTVKEVDVINLEKAVPVYDLSVPKAENFLSATGIILHNSGHPSFSTFHAASVETLVRRLETPPINLPASLVDSLDIVCSVIHIKDQRRNMRRVKDVKEIIEVKQQVGTVESNTLFEWNQIEDKFVYNGNSHIMAIISKRTGTTIKELEEEIRCRGLLLTKMLERNLTHYRDVTKYVNEYYKDPLSVLKVFGIK
ncbi:Flp pilus assembly complex ATPase component TadA [Candidatus Woesearchaeota archaeon]|nr:Flp pilus assembly complex ATPase component TadA [Candidatus Woesearchaeota archaeon]